MGIMILGDPFFRSFYISFDYTANIVSIAPSVTPPKIRDQMSIWTVVGVVITSVLLTAVGVNL
jgi:hypothetical protein